MFWALLGCIEPDVVRREGVQIGQEGIPPKCGPTDLPLDDLSIAPGELEAEPGTVRDAVPSHLTGTWTLTDGPVQDLTLDLEVTAFGWRTTLPHPDLPPSCYVDDVYVAALTVTRTVDGEETVEAGELLATDPSALGLTVWLTPGSPLPPSTQPDLAAPEALLVGEVGPDTAAGEVVWRGRTGLPDEPVGVWTAER